MVIDDKADAINALIDAVETIEHELGITPSGVYSDVRVRLDILEARINNPFAPAPNVENPFIIGNDGVTISTGTGFPTENRLPGSLYMRKDGYNNEGLYARRPDMMWHQIDTDPWTAAGDLAGTIYSQTVIGLQNRPLSAAQPIDSPAGDGYVVGWNSFLSQWEPQVGFYAFGDLTGTKINQTVVNLQGTPIVIGTMDGYKDGYTLIWNNTVPRWEPQRLAVVFDPLDNSSTTNIRSNRYTTQSFVDGTKTGIVNLGSDSTQTSVGATADYATILGGDQHEVSGDYSVIAGGLLSSITDVLGFIGGGTGHSIIGDRGFIGGGDSNAVSGTIALVAGGFNNQANGGLSAVVGGESNVTDGDHSFMGGGGFNTINLSQFSTILGGQSHTMTDGNFSSMLSGQSNTIIGAPLSFADILGGSLNQINGAGNAYLTLLGGNQNTLLGFFNLIGVGQLNIVSSASYFSSILNGKSNSTDGYHNTILAGDTNTIVGNYNTILSGLNNSILSNTTHNVVSGQGNSVSASFSVVAGLNNTVAAGTNNFTTIYGDNNIINSGSHYSGVWGCSNTLNDGYIAMFGDHNTMNSGSTFADIHGDHNTVGNSKYTSIWGNLNTIGDTATYATIFGASNTINNGASSSGIYGTNNTLSNNSSYSYLYGNANVTVGASTYSSAWGSNNSVASNYANIWGSFNSTVSGADWSTVFGYYGKAIFPGQFIHSAYAIDGSTAGSSQFSRVILSGSGSSPFTLTIPTTLSNLTLENGKCYDMTIRVLINRTTGSPTCARYVFDIMAHCESGVLTLDVVNTTISNDNSTGYTVAVTSSSNQLVLTVNSADAPVKRAVATVEWRELSRL